MNIQPVTLNPLEMFFIVTTVISLVVNLIQWRDRRAFQAPLTNSLVALFNDIKSKTFGAQFVYNALFNPENPHENIETLRWEYGLFVQEMTTFFQGFQESVVAVLVTLNPKDKEGAVVFRASDYGLTDQEKAWRQNQLELRREQYSQPVTEPDVPGEDSPTEEPTTTDVSAVIEASNVDNPEQETSQESQPAPNQEPIVADEAPDRDANA